LLLMLLRSCAPPARTQASTDSPSQHDFAWLVMILLVLDR
jgi:hypothetical protein